jgi:DNA-binding GntR family transcriptional regulator
MVAHRDAKKLIPHAESAHPKPLTTYTETVCQYLRDAILSQRIKPLERLQEKAIAQQFGISITPVREAIRRLEGEGYLDVHGHRGVAVRTTSEAELREIYRVIGVLDSYAVSLAIRRMGPDARRELQERTDEMEGYYRNKRIMEYLQANMRIHGLIWTLSGNRFLVRTLEQIQARMFQFPLERNALHSRPGVLEKSMESHRRILKALQRGQGKEVEQMCRNHWDLLAGPADGQ